MAWKSVSTCECSAKLNRSLRANPKMCNITCVFHDASNRYSKMKHKLKLTAFLGS